MKLIIGLGNPGAQYEKTWHNLGFMAVEKFRQELEFAPFKPAKKLRAEISLGNLGREKIILARPQTYMNNSGQAAAALAKYYKIPLKDIIVLHDDVDLPLGKIRIAADSSSGGHNGVKSLIEHLGIKDFVRLKIGCRTKKTGIVGTLDYVLEKIAKADSQAVNDILDKSSQAMQTLIRDGAAPAMNKFN